MALLHCVRSTELGVHSNGVWMADDARSETTALLCGLVRGDADAERLLWPRVYAELRALAGSYFRARAADTLQPTALVHEAYLRMAGHDDAEFESRAHFMAVAAKVMRNILIDHARRESSAKRGGGMTRITLSDQMAATTEPDVDVLALDEVVSRVSALDERKGRVLELRFFGGLSIEQTALVLGIARSTVTEDWRVARAWVVKELLDGERK